VPTDRELRLGTRGSQLALWQANTVAARIAEASGRACRLVTIKTSGDRLQDAPLSEAGGKRLFVKELEDALLRGEIDLAVHSSKDMPVVLPDGLAIAAALPREDPRDAVILPIRLEPDPTQAAPDPTRALAFDEVDALMAALGPSPAIGTSSVRRIAQLSWLLPNARFSPIRGNLDTRLRKLDEGQYDALVLAAAGLRRLGFSSRISMALPASACVPAPGQGIVAVEIRAEDDDTRRSVASINDRLANAALTAERALVTALGGGCQTPIGALASPLDGETLELVAIVAAPDGSRAVRAQRRGRLNDAATLGSHVAAELVALGADEILAAAQKEQSTVNSRQSIADY
jgi:hydroxymethylbilane synthase